MRKFFSFTIAICFIFFSIVSFANVKYISKDAKTKGDWIGKYGSAGGVIFDNGGKDNANINGKQDDQLIKGVLKEYDDAGRPRWNWASHTNDQRGLQYVGKKDDRIGACIWGTGTTTITLTVDANEYTLEAYFVDWDSSVRVQEITGYQGNKPPAKADAMLQGPEFHNGVWHLWNVTGNEPFKLNITHKGGANWVASAFLVDVKASVDKKNKLATIWGKLKEKARK